MEVIARRFSVDSGKCIKSRGKDLFYSDLLDKIIKNGKLVQTFIIFKELQSIFKQIT